MMTVPSSFLINSFSSFLLIIVKSSATDLKCFWPFDSKKLTSVKPKLKSANGVDELQFAKFQNILTFAS